MALEPDVQDAIDKLVATRDSPGYLILLERIQRERAAALEDLIEVDPLDNKEIMRLQNVCKRFEYFAETIDELILSGVQKEVLAEEETTYED